MTFSSSTIRCFILGSLSLFSLSYFLIVPAFQKENRSAQLGDYLIEQVDGPPETYTETTITVEEEATPSWLSNTPPSYTKSMLLGEWSYEENAVINQLTLQESGYILTSKEADPTKTNGIDIEIQGKWNVSDNSLLLYPATSKTPEILTTLAPCIKRNIMGVTPQALILTDNKKEKTIWLSLKKN